ncbi:MAG TPA: endo-1,4-beta-xylanase, partial [Balneolales bacterium]|nr:endo-1,4-beta-xylanase [Balneolales bacterium]
MKIARNIYFKAFKIPILIGGLFIFIAAGQKIPSLKKVFKKDFYVGVAMNWRQIEGKSPSDIQLIKEQFNSTSPANVLKWSEVQPKPHSFQWGPADAYVNFGLKHHMFIIGHNLVWHKQVPKWVFLDKKGKPVSRAVLLKRMKYHIDKVVGRYSGKINGWDVVNEALTEKGELRNTKWKKIIGP